MAVFPMVKGVPSGGGVTSIVADTSQTLGSITSAGGSYTASDNCIMIGTFRGSSGGQASISIDGDLFFATDDGSYGSYLGYGSYGIFIPKGSVITARSGYGIYNLIFYKIA